MAKNEMRAVAIDRFGGPETLSVKSVPIPEPKVDQVLIRVGSAGLGVWDIGEREGYIARMYGHKPTFPYVLGTEGAGKVTATGEEVKNFRKGDLVYGLTWGTNPKAGFDAEYVAVGADWVSPIPSNLSIEQAGALMIDGAVALRGLDEILKVKGSENLLVFGASGGVGHLAVQIGVRMGAHVFAVASGDDGVKLAHRLGAEEVVDGRGGDIVASARRFAPRGFDAALFTASGEAADLAVSTMRDGGRVAHPFGLDPALKVRPTVSVQSFNGGEYWNVMPQALVARLNALIEAGPFEVHLSMTFPLEKVGEAHAALQSHHVGKMALLPGA
jgi:NADPH2:quinone reductase